MLPHELYDAWSVTDLNDYASYCDAKEKKPKGRGKRGRTYTDDMDRLFRK